MKKCSLRLLSIVLLVCVALSPAYCGWDAFKSSSPELSVGSSTSETTEKSEPTITEQPTTSSEEAKPDESQTEKLLEKSNVSSKDYDDALDATEDAIAVAEEAVKDEPEKAEAIADLKEKVDELIVSKAVLDEDQELLEGVVQKQTKALEKAERKLEGINFGLGLSFGYRPLLSFSPGVTFQMRSGNWTFRTDLIYEVDVTATRAEMLDPRNLEVRLGVIYEF